MIYAVLDLSKNDLNGKKNITFPEKDVFKMKM